MYIEGPLPLYILYVSTELTKQDQHQETLVAEGDKGSSETNLKQVAWFA